MIQNILIASSLLLNLLALACGQMISQPTQSDLILTASPNTETARPAEMRQNTIPATELPESTAPPTETLQGTFPTTGFPESTMPTGLVEEAEESIGKWKRYEVSYENPSWDGNPFDLELTATFTHVPSGRTLNQLGFYAGDNVWKIYFMPDELGEWTFTTSSPDPELDGKTGAFTCVNSDLPGQLIGDGNRWKLKDSGEHLAPIILPTREWFKRTDTENGIDDFILWAKNTTGTLIIGTTLVYFSHAQEESPYIKGEEGETFNVEMWDRLNSHYDMLRDQGMGFYIMFYSDEAESPNAYGIGPESPEELRLFRYAVARFSAYPIVMWDTGIDIGETRDFEWIDWFSTWFNSNDPWKHLVSSRSGGGSGGKLPETATYYSDGAATLPKHELVVDQWSSLTIPLAYTDRWRENYYRGNFDRDKIRRAAWEVGLVGGTAVYISGNENDGYLNQTYASDLEAAPDLGHRNRFFRDHIIDLARLNPHDEMISSGNDVVLSADPLKEYVVYDWNGGTFGIDLSDINGSFSATWYNPRTGAITSAGIVVGGGIPKFTTPDNQDWVLHLTGTSVSINPCSSPSLAVQGRADDQPLQIELDPAATFRVYLPMSMQCGG